MRPTYPNSLFLLDSGWIILDTDANADFFQKLEIVQRWNEIGSEAGLNNPITCLPRIICLPRISLVKSQ